MSVKKKTTTTKIIQSKVIPAPVELKKGSIVEYEIGFMRVTSCFKDTVNLGSIFCKHIYHKGVDKKLVKEASAAFWKHWETTESYQHM